MSILKYGDKTITPTPIVSIERQFVGAVDGAFQGYRQRWRLSGTVIAATPALIQTEYEALETAFATAGDNLILYADDGVTVKHQILNSECLNGVKIVKPMSYPKGEGAELATIRTWAVELEGIHLLAGAPSATAWGESSTDMMTDAQGQVHITVSGRYQGPGAQAAADAAKLAGHHTESEQQRTNADTQEVFFSYQYIDDNASREIIRYTETVSIEEALSKFAWRFPLGDTPIQQTTISGLCRVVQSGESVGLNSRTAAASLKYAEANLVSKRKTYRGARRTKGGSLTEYVTAWEYVYEFAATPATVYPSDAPA